MKLLEGLVTIAAVLGVGCAEQSVTSKDGGGTDGAMPVDAAPSDAGMKDVQPYDAGSVEGLVFNEVSSRGGDWVELYNKGSATVDLTGLRITDDDKDGGAPRVATALQFKDGTKLSPSAYLVVLGNQPTASADLGPCFDGGVAGCPSVTFGISKSLDNTLFVLAPDDKSIITVDVPANSTMSGQTWGRFPNGTGAFGVTKPTPGAANTQ